MPSATLVGGQYFIVWELFTCRESLTLLSYVAVREPFTPSSVTPVKAPVDPLFDVT